MLNKNTARIIIKNLLSQGASYADCLFETAKDTSHTVRDGKVIPSYNESTGAYVRAFKDGLVYFESTTNVEDSNLIRISENLLGGKSISEANFEFTFEDKVEMIESNSKYTDEAIIEYMSGIDKRMHAYSDKVKNSTISFSYEFATRIIATSEGRFISEDSAITTFGVSVNSKFEEVNEMASEKVSKKMNVDDFFANNLDEIERCVTAVPKLAIELLSAQRIKSGKMPVVIGNGFGGVLFHEACGHSLEATFISKNTSTYAGKVGELVASELVCAYDDPTIASERGSYVYDDEGTKATRKTLIENGVLKGYLVDKFHGEMMSEDSNGSSRTMAYTHNPVSRMSNTFIGNGTSTFNEVFEGIEYGFYAKGFAGGQVDPFTGEFNFGVSEGYIIRDGKICELVKGATLIGKGSEVLQKIDKVGNDFALAAGTCGAASGMIPTTVGQPTLRVSEMTVGGE